MRFQDTFGRAKTWVKELQRQASPNIVIALAGNKADLANKRMVEYEVCQMIIISVTHNQYHPSIYKCCSNPASAHPFRLKIEGSFETSSGKLVTTPFCNLGYSVGFHRINTALIKHMLNFKNQGHSIPGSYMLKHLCRFTCYVMYSP